MHGFTTTADKARKIDMKFLREEGLLCGLANRSINWTCGGEPSGSVWATVNIGSVGDSCYMELDYKIRSNGWDEWQPIKYGVQLIPTPCRYGGKRWWFRCPNTRCERRVRILYESGDYFVCRKCAHLWYDSQKYMNQKFKLWGDLFRAEELKENMKRWYYRGRPTRKHRKYLKLTQGMNWQERAETKKQLLFTL